jgi:hypothetical protein
MAMLHSLPRKTSRGSGMGFTSTCQRWTNQISTESLENKLVQGKNSAIKQALSAQRRY